MTMGMKPRMPDEKEKEILGRNGIDTEGVSVIYRDEREIVILKHKTRDTICIMKGEKPWE
jgi:hypothetical protein